MARLLSSPWNAAVARTARIGSRIRSPERNAASGFSRMVPPSLDALRNWLSQPVGRRSTRMSAESLEELLARVRACRLCEASLPLGPLPVLRASGTARVLIVGQAPGRRVHATGIPWNDPSGDRLRDWLELSKEEFYDESRIAIIPVGLCYPGTLPGGSGDAPPRPECAPFWHPQLRAALPGIRLTLLVGAHAQAFYLKKRVGRTLAATVETGYQFLPDFLPLPHPSPRNLRWFRNHPWFEREILPDLRRRVRALLRG